MLILTYSDLRKTGAELFYNNDCWKIWFTLFFGELCYNTALFNVFGIFQENKLNLPNMKIWVITDFDVTVSLLILPLRPTFSLNKEKMFQNLRTRRNSTWKASWKYLAKFIYCIDQTKQNVKTETHQLRVRHESVCMPMPSFAHPSAPQNATEGEVMCFPLFLKLVLLRI